MRARYPRWTDELMQRKRLKYAKGRPPDDEADRALWVQTPVIQLQARGTVKPSLYPTYHSIITGACQEPAELLERLRVALPKVLHLPSHLRKLRGEVIRGGGISAPRARAASKTIERTQVVVDAAISECDCAALDDDAA